jgi:hypothetical protein
LVEAAKAVQEVLGERQDAAVARPVFREIAVQAHPEGESTFTYGLLHERQIARGAAGGGPAVGCMANDTAPREALPTLRPYGRSAETTPNRPGGGPMDHPRVRSGRP